LKLLILSPELLEASGKLGKLLLKSDQPALDIGCIASLLRAQGGRQQQNGRRNNAKADRLRHASTDPAITSLHQRASRQCSDGSAVGHVE